MVANCLPESDVISPERDQETKSDEAPMDCGDNGPLERGNPVSHRDLNPPGSLQQHRDVPADAALRFVF